MRILAIMMAFTLSAMSARAWGPDGHMVVAAAAWKKLTPEVQKEAARLLQMNPSYDSWISGISAAERDEIAFIMAATWPDEIKGNRNYKNDGEHPPAGPQSSQNIGYSDMLQHRYWHFYDTPFSPDSTPLGKPDPVNALTQIQLFTAAIKTTTDDSIKSYDLVWLIHIVGDVHQPLHATTRFDAQDPKGDEGGNRIIICSVPPASADSKCSSELHGFWDDVPGVNRGPESARTQTATLPAPGATATDADPTHWIDESFLAAKESAYANPPIGVGDGPFVLTPAYRSKASSVVQARLALAAARLADLLNQNLVSSH